MSGIVPSCNLVQYQGKLMQPWENGKNPNLERNLPPPKKNFSWVLPLVVFKQCSKLSSYAISKKTNELSYFGPNFCPLGRDLDPIFFFFFFFFFQGLPLLVVRHCSKLSLYTISRKTNEPNWGNDKKPSFGPNFGQFDPKSGHQIYLQKPGSVSHEIWWSAIIMYNIRKKLMI